MKNIILLIIVVIIFGIGFFLGKGSPQGVRLSQPRDNNTIISRSGVVVQDGSTGAVAPISKEKFTQLCIDYVMSGNSGELLNNNGDDAIRLIDNAKALYPFTGSLLILMQTSPEKRIDTLKGALKNMKPDSMSYITISDYLNGTHLCDSFSRKNQCNEQLEVLKMIMDQKNISQDRITLDQTSKIALYGIQQNFSKEDYIKFIRDLTLKHCNSL